MIPGKCGVEFHGPRSTWRPRGCILEVGGGSLSGDLSRARCSFGRADLVVVGTWAAGQGVCHREARTRWKDGWSQAGWTECVEDRLSALLQVPCYVFDGEFKKHDLNPLIKLSGAYLVDDSDPDTSLFINVCRDIGVDLVPWARGGEGLVEASWSLPSACLLLPGEPCG